MRQLDRIIEDSSRASDMDRSNVEYYHVCGLARERKGQLEAALDCYEVRAAHLGHPTRHSRKNETHRLFCRILDKGYDRPLTQSWPHRRYLFGCNVDVAWVGRRMR